MDNARVCSGTGMSYRALPSKQQTKDPFTTRSSQQLCTTFVTRSPHIPLLLPSLTTIYCSDPRDPILGQTVPAVDDEICSGHVTAGVRGQEDVRLPSLALVPCEHPPVVAGEVVWRFTYPLQFVRIAEPFARHHLVPFLLPFVW